MPANEELIGPHFRADRIGIQTVTLQHSNQAAKPTSFLPSIGTLIRPSKSIQHSHHADSSLHTSMLLRRDIRRDGRDR